MLPCAILSFLAFSAPLSAPVCTAPITRPSTLYPVLPPYPPTVLQPRRLSRSRKPISCEKSELPAPKWVNTLNAALEEGAAAYLVSYIVIDLGLAFVLLVTFLALRINVSADFALAFAICKSPPLRGPRIALDASVAAGLTRMYPPLASVRASLLTDAAARMMSLSDIGERFKLRSQDAVEGKKGGEDSSGKEGFGAKARRLTDAYGLAFLAAKNVIGPLTIFAVYAAIRALGTGGSTVMGDFSSAWLGRVLLGTGTGVTGASGALGGVASLGNTAGAIALASTISHILFPLVVFGAAKAAPALGRLANQFVDHGS
jgi:hypothetical protein